MAIVIMTLFSFSFLFLSGLVLASHSFSFVLSFHFRWFAIREFHLFGGSFASTGCDVLRREKKEKKIRDIYTTHCTHCTDRSISEYQAKISTAKRRQCLSGQPPPDRLLFRCCQGQAEIPDTAAPTASQGLRHSHAHHNTAKAARPRTPCV